MPATWAERITELAKDNPLGMHLCDIPWMWHERWPEDRFEDFKPCKKMKDAIVKYTSDMVVYDSRVYYCSDVPSDDEVNTQPQARMYAEEEAKRMYAMPLEDRIRLREEFADFGFEWHLKMTAYPARMHDVKPYKCNMFCEPPASEDFNELQLVGAWEYEERFDQGRRYRFHVSARAGDLVYSERCQNGSTVTGILRKSAEEPWWEVEPKPISEDASLSLNTDGVILALRYFNKGLEMRSRQQSMEDWEIPFPAQRVSYSGFGLSPLMAATTAMEAAMADFGGARRSRGASQKAALAPPRNPRAQSTSSAGPAV